MGASLLKLYPGGSKEEEKRKSIIKSYDMHFQERIMKELYSHDTNKKAADNFYHFHQAVCKTVEDINQKAGYTQICIPNTEDLKGEFYYKAGKNGGKLTNKDFQEILTSLFAKAKFTNLGALDTFLYILSAPATALVVKNAVKPNAISNQVLIPGVTSATVLILAALKKI